jgi:hypothetical protein
VFACPAPPPYAAPAADRPSYVLDVRVRPGLKVATGDLSVRFTPNRSTDRLVFRLWPNGPAQLRQGSRLSVGRATADGSTLRETHPDPTTLVVYPQQALSAGSTITVSLTWRLRIPATGRDRISRFVTGVRLGSFFPILAWDPGGRGWVTDRPVRILAESSTSPTADFDVHVAVPPGFRALVSGTPTGNGRWQASAVRDIAVSVARFAIVTGTAHAPGPVTVRVGIAAGSRVAPRTVLRLALRAIHRLAGRYGPYPWPTYTVVVAPDMPDEGIEYPNLVFVGGGMLLEPIVDHETAHQWFYSLVGNDQARDPWLDEALATWAELQLGPGVAHGLRLIPKQVATHVGAPVSYWGRRERAYFAHTYGGGIRALASLGPPARVDCALRLYAARNAYRIAAPGDLLDALNSVFPGAERHLRRFGIRR